MATTKTASLDKTQTMEFINSFLEEYQNWFNSTTPPTIHDLDKFVTKNFQHISNHKITSKNPSEFLNRILNFRKKFSHLELSFPSEEAIVSGNKAVIQYDFVFTAKNGQKATINFMAIATFQDNKVSRWFQVASEQGSSRWDSAI